VELPNDLPDDYTYAIKFTERKHNQLLSEFKNEENED